ncbi:hypothetical protein [Brevibacillus fulvus]|uniref:Uncharacterized protein n=1 Tax=Brevibacillus fulvus TaxID=1125967 RepID=A0A938Y6T5_9BACL|nr:hypothetical protein [Brevibacillus fulvus]
MQKKAEMKALLELANHHATFAVDQELKTEGIIELTEAEAMAKFDQRMLDNGGYERVEDAYVPSANSVTSAPVSFVHYYVGFQDWRKDLHLFVRQRQEGLAIEKAEDGPERTAGGELRVTFTTASGEELQLAPKKMVGPSLVVVAFLEEPPLVPFLPGHAIPIVSVEEVKW